MRALTVMGLIRARMIKGLLVALGIVVCVPAVACASEPPPALVRAIELYRIEEPLRSDLLEHGAWYAIRRGELDTEYASLMDSDLMRRRRALAEKLDPPPSRDDLLFPGVAEPARAPAPADDPRRDDLAVFDAQISARSRAIRDRLAVLDARFLERLAEALAAQEHTARGADAFTVRVQHEMLRDTGWAASRSDHMRPADIARFVTSDLLRRALDDEFAWRIADPAEREMAALALRTELHQLVIEYDRAMRPLVIDAMKPRDARAIVPATIDPALSTMGQIMKRRAPMWSRRQATADQFHERAVALFAAEFAGDDPRTVRFHQLAFHAYLSEMDPWLAVTQWGENVVAWVEAHGGAEAVTPALRDFERAERAAAHAFRQRAFAQSRACCRAWSTIMTIDPAMADDVDRVQAVARAECTRLRAAGATVLEMLDPALHDAARAAMKSTIRKVGFGSY